MSINLRMGLDLGVASVGWALLEYDGDHFIRIVACGSRIVPQGTHAGEFQRGEAITKNANRRQQRSARRIRQRYKQRRENLRSVLTELGVSVQAITSEMAKGTNPVDRYSERADAVDKAVPLEALGRILWRINDRRGYKSNRHERADLAKKKKSEKSFDELSVVSRRNTGEVLRKKPVIELTLSNGVVAKTTDSALLAAPDGLVLGVELEAKQRKNALEPSYTVKLADDAEWGSRLAKLETDLEKSGLTPGQYFAKQLSANPHYRVRQRLVYRQRYFDEFDCIWSMQSSAHPILVDQETYERILSKVLPRNTKQFSHWAKKSLGDFVRDYILFYQRPLKTKRSTVGDCPLERVTVDYVDRDTGEVTKKQIARKVIPASHPLYQEYRVWAAINNIRLRKDGEQEGKPLPDELKARLYGVLQLQGALSAKKLSKLFPEVDSSIYHISAQEILPGNVTLAKLEGAVNKVGAKLSTLGVSDRESLIDLWHLLYSHNDDVQAVHKALTGRFGMSEEVAEALGYVVFARDRGAYSAKAINKILPLMRAGDYHDSSRIKQHAKQRLLDYCNGELPPALDQVLAKSGLVKSANLSIARGMSVYSALALQYGHHEGSRKEVAALESWSDIELVSRHSLRNPIVERIVNEALLVVRDVWRTYGRPDAVRVELARELKSSSQERERTHKGMRDRERENATVRSELGKAPFSLSSPTRKDVTRYRLWNEQRRRCVFTGRSIQASDLLSGATDIDHILPQQRYQDDSFGNKVLTFRAVNEAKGNATAIEFIRNGSASIEVYEEAAFKQNVLDTYPNPHSRKRELLLAEDIPDDFGQRALQNTRYMSKQMTKLLEPICPGKVLSTAGVVTSLLRRSWGLDEVFKELVRPRFERLSKIHEVSWAEEKTTVNGHRYLWLKNYSKRVDHRHHALDAIVTAATTQGMVQRLANLNQAFEASEAEGKVRMDKAVSRHIMVPTIGFDQQVLIALRGVIVSHKPTNRLLTQSVNRYQVRDPETGKIVKLRQNTSQTKAVRGQLHVEQAFGLVRSYERVEVKKGFARSEDIAVEWQRSLIIGRLEKYDEDIKAVLKSLKKEPLLTPNGEPLTEIIVWKEAFAKNRALAGLTKKELTEIADDSSIGETLRNFIEETGADGKPRSLDAETIARFNGQRTSGQGGDIQPVITVRTHSFGNKVRLVRQGGPVNQWIDTGDSYALGVVEDDEGGRKFENVKFYDAIQRMLADEAPLGDVTFAIQKGSTYALPSSEGEYEIDGQFFQLYVNRRISDQSPSTRFAPISLAIGLPLEFISASYTDSSPNSTESLPRVIRNLCYPVHVDRLGNISFSNSATTNNLSR